MRDDEKPSPAKEPYHAPEIVDLGDVVASTTGLSTPVREFESDPPRWYDNSYFNGPDAPEVVLDDEE